MTVMQLRLVSGTLAEGWRITDQRRHPVSCGSGRSTPKLLPSIALNCPHNEMKLKKTVSKQFHFNAWTILHTVLTVQERAGT